MAYGYDKNKDYSELIKKAVNAGDFASAAILEAQRNEKIKGEGMTEYQPTSTYASFLPGQTKFQNPYAADLQAALSGMQDVGAYKKQYLQGADRTMKDTLGQVGAMTGGLPSTQAVAAASQAADNTKAQLDSKVQSLQQNNYNAILNASQQAQSQWQTNINTALNRWNQLGYADQQVSDILGVPVGTSTADQSYRNWQMGQQEKSDAYSLAMNLLAAGQMPDEQTLAAAGMSTADAQKLMAQPTVVYSGGGSYGGSSASPVAETTGKEPLPLKEWDNLYEKYQECALQGDFSAYYSKLANNARQYDISEFEGYMANSVPGYDEQGSVLYGKGMEESLFSNVLRTMRYSSVERLVELAEQYSGQMSKAQWAEVERLLKQRGI